MKNLIIGLFALTATVLQADPGHHDDKGTPPSTPTTETFTYTVPFNSTNSVVAPDTNLVSVTIEFTATVDEQIYITNNGPDTDTFWTVFHVGPSIETPAGILTVTNNFTNTVVIASGQTTTFTFNWTAGDNYFITNNLSDWQSGFVFIPRLRGSIDAGGGGNASMSARLLPTSGVTLKITYEYLDCGCDDPDDDGDCEDQEHKHRKHHRKDKKKKK